MSLDVALRDGRRGLPGGSSLVDLLDEHRLGNGRVLTIQRILAWADAHHAATGRWPGKNSTRIDQTPFTLTWLEIDQALKHGLHGLRAGLSLARVLCTNRGIPLPIRETRPPSRAKSRRRKAAARKVGPQPLTIAQVLAWADAHHAATGKWPSRISGACATPPASGGRRSSRRCERAATVCPRARRSPASSTSTAQDGNGG